MAIVFEQFMSPFSNTSPAVSGSFTPVVPGSALICLSQDGGSNNTPTFTGTGTWNNVGTTVLLPGTAESVGANLSSTAGAQTVTVTAATAAFRCLLAEYAGVGVVGTYTAVQNVTPGTGAGAVLGTSVVVPTNSFLVAICFNITGNGAMTATAGTSRGASSIGALAFNWNDYTGTGASIQPAFTCATGTTDTLNVMQFLLTPSGGGSNSATIAWVT